MNQPVTDLQSHSLHNARAIGGSVLATVVLIAAFVWTGSLYLLSAIALVPGFLALFFFYEQRRSITNRHSLLGAVVLVSEAVIFLLSYGCPAVLDDLLGNAAAFGLKVEFCIPGFLIAYVFAVTATYGLFARPVSSERP